MPSRRIDYETFCKIRDCRDRQRLTITQTARAITRLLDSHPYSAQQIFQRLREEGYRGGITVLRDYVRRIRPTKRPVYLIRSPPHTLTAD